MIADDGFAVRLRVVLTQALHEWDYIDMRTYCDLKTGEFGRPDEDERHFHEELDELIADLLEINAKLVPA